MHTVNIDIGWLLCLLGSIFWSGASFHWYLCGWVLVGKEYLKYLTETERQTLFISVTQSASVLGLIVFVIGLLVLIVRLSILHTKHQICNWRRRNLLLEEVKRLEKKSRKTRKEVCSLKSKLEASNTNLDECRQELNAERQKRERCYCPHTHRLQVFSPEHGKYVYRSSICCQLVLRLRSEISFLKKQVENVRKYAKAYKLWQMAQPIVDMTNVETSDWAIAIQSAMPWLTRQAVNLRTRMLQNKVVTHAQLVAEKDETLNALELDHQKLQKSLKEKQGVITHTESVIRSQSIEIASLREDLSRAVKAQELNSTTMKVQQKDDSVVRLANEVEEWQHKHKRLQQVKLNAESDLAKVRHELNDVRLKYETLVTESNNNKVTTSEPTEKNSVSKEDLSELQKKASLADAAWSAADDLEAENTKLTNENEAKDKKIHSLERIAGQVEELRNQLHQKDTHIKDVQTKLAQLIEEQENAKSCSSDVADHNDDAEVHSLLHRAKEQVTALETNVATAESTNVQLQGDIQILQQRLNEVQWNCRQLESNKVQFEAENTTLRSQVETLQANIITVKLEAESSHAIILESERAEFQRQLNNEAAQVLEKDLEINQFNETRHNLEQSLAMVQTQLNRMQQKMHDKQLKAEQDEKRALMTGAAFNPKHNAEQIVKLKDLLDKHKIAADKDITIIDRVEHMINVYNDFYATWRNLDQNNIHRGANTLFQRTEFLIKDVKTIWDAVAKHHLIWSNKQTKQFEPLASAVVRVVDERMCLFKDMDNLKVQLARAFPDVQTKERLMTMSGKEVFDHMRRLVDDHVRIQSQAAVAEAREVKGMTKKRARALDDE